MTTVAKPACSKNDVYMALLALRGHYPGEHPAIDQATALTWHESGLRVIETETLTATVTSWSTEDHPKFPTSGEFLTGAREVGRMLALERRDRDDAARGVDPRGRCSECDGHVVVEVLRDGLPPAYRPCSKCNPRGYWLFYFGHYDVDHACGLCELLKKGGKAANTALTERMGSQPAPDPPPPGSLDF